MWAGHEVKLANQGTIFFRIVQIFWSIIREFILFFGIQSTKSMLFVIMFIKIRLNYINLKILIFTYMYAISPNLSL